MDSLDNKVANGGASAAGKLASTEWNQAAAELENAFVEVGVTPSSGDLFQVAKAIMAYGQGYAFWGTASGPSTAYVITELTVSVEGVGLFDGMTVKFRPNVNNTTTTPTINVFGTGVKNIVNEAGGAIAVGDLSTLRDAEVRYDGTDWRLLSRCLGLRLDAFYPSGHIRGFSLSNAPADTDHDITIQPGECQAISGDFNFDVATVFTKQLDVTWAAGTSAGGRPNTVSLAADTWYYVYIIGGAGATNDYGFDTHIAAINLLSYASSETGDTYNKFRRIGAILTDSSQNIKQFLTDSADYGLIHWADPVRHVNISLSSGTDTTKTAFTADGPLGSSAILQVSAAANSSSGTRMFIDVRGNDEADIAPSQTNHVIRSWDEFGAHEWYQSTQVRVPLSATSQASYRCLAVTNNLNTLELEISTRGYVWNRRDS